MPELNDVQKQAVSDWVAQGAGISEVQRRLQSEFDITMTFMDVRFLLLDMPVTLKDKPTSGSDASLSGVGADLAGGAEPGAAGGALRVTFDKVMQAGALVSGAVTFSDGVTATWMLDQTGRLALNASVPGYQPSENDLQEFQIALRNGLQKMGY